ncbi:hypothetical protein NHP21005_11750 [Helicobacter sp. NHP21005]|uniref:HipA N-terminal domain-containing protein n=1 Tax=Helicobacter felistomachi TaxID=3040201 RepID=UPI0025730C09|nr:HipA N-terminal domain-containing protein [Helicobacter sp. NHP21005]BEG57487.1 hypothetical protein NHP21005_11750 [Helicobacter sp. NHP21005]
MTISIFCNTTSVGTLEIWAKGLKETYQFTYSPKWLQQGFSLDPALPFCETPTLSTTLWGCFTDTCPDRWGRFVQRGKQGLLSPSAYLLGVSDFFRLGALRCFVGNAFISNTSQIPKPIHLQDLQRACVKLEQGQASQADFQKLLAPKDENGQGVR